MKEMRKMPGKGTIPEAITVPGGGAVTTEPIRLGDTGVTCVTSMAAIGDVSRVLGRDIT